MNPVYIKIDEYGSRYYYSDVSMKTLHRTDGPAIEYWSGTKTWYVNDQIHRTDGPAVEHPHGSKEWWLNDQRHRTDGPAYEGAGGCKFWYVNDQLHRTDGPAIEYADGDKEWYLNGQFMTEAEFLAETATEVVLTLDEIAAKFGISVENLKIAK